jgi:hypothetical protein
MTVVQFDVYKYRSSNTEYSDKTSNPKNYSRNRTWVSLNSCNNQLSAAFAEWFSILLYVLRISSATWRFLAILSNVQIQLGTLPLLGFGSLLHFTLFLPKSLLITILFSPPTLATMESTYKALQTTKGRERFKITCKRDLYTALDSDTIAKVVGGMTTKALLSTAER